jgi:hypothetical protein
VILLVTVAVKAIAVVAVDVEVTLADVIEPVPVDVMILAMEPVMIPAMDVMDALVIVQEVVQVLATEDALATVMVIVLEPVEEVAVLDAIQLVVVRAVRLVQEDAQTAVLAAAEGLVLEHHDKGVKICFLLKNIHLNLNQKLILLLLFRLGLVIQ